MTTLFTETTFIQPMTLDTSTVYFYSAEEGSIIKVELDNVPIDHSPLPNLDDPKRICINAQDEYKKVKYVATVKPVGTKAKAFSTGADVAVTFAGVDGTDPNALEDGHEFWVIGGADTGDYEVTIKHLDLETCTASDGEAAFKFVYVHNTSTTPSSRTSFMGAGHHTDTSVGGVKNGGFAQARWSQADTDSEYLDINGIGDADLDVQPVVWAKAANREHEPEIPYTPAAENDVEYWAVMRELGVLQIGTVPDEMHSGRLAWELNVSLNADARTCVWPSFALNMSIGASVGPVSCGITLWEFSKNFAAAGGAGIWWESALDTAADFKDAFTMGTISRIEDFEIRLESTLSDDSLPPWETEGFGFSSGVTLKENINPDWYTGYSEIRSYEFSIDDITFSIRP